MNEKISVRYSGFQYDPSQCEAIATSSAYYHQSRKPGQCLRETTYMVGGKGFCHQHAGMEVVRLIMDEKAVLMRRVEEP